MREECPECGHQLEHMHDDLYRCWTVSGGCGKLFRYRKGKFKQEDMYK